MNKLILLIYFFLISSISQGEEICNLHESRSIPLFSSGEPVLLDVKIQGGECYKSTLIISIYRAGKELYAYSAPFKKHTAINWEVLDEIDAIEYINGIYKSYNFMSCAEIFPEMLDELDGYNYNTLRVSSEQYERFRRGNCRVFKHQTHYEETRVIVFPEPESLGVVISEYGL